MESDRFDELTARLTQGLTRRRSVGLLGAIGITGVSLTHEAAAKKSKHKRKKRKHHATTTVDPACARCTACEVCVSGACLPLADGAPCGAGAVCLHGGCGTACTADGNECPEDQGIRCPSKIPVRACLDTNTITCQSQNCVLDANCPIGSICVSVGSACSGDPKKCVKVVRV